MLKSFKEMYNLNIDAYKQKKPTFKKVNGKTEKLPEKYWLDYIEWSMAIFLLYENGAGSVIYEFTKNKDGYPAHFDHNGRNPFIEVVLKIDDKEYKYHYPVIDGNRTDENPSQMSIHRAQQRGLVKCIAVNTGLGLKLWQKEEKTFDDLGVINDESGKPELKPETKLWQEAVKALKNGYKITDIRKKYFMTEDSENKLLDESI